MSRPLKHYHNELTTGEAATYCGVSAQTIINWCEMGRLRWSRIDGGPRRIPRWEIAELLRRNNMPVPPELADAKPPAAALQAA
jgi:excisionase family DNA binding protein